MVTKKRFEYNSVQDVESIADYLNALIEGFQKGELEFSYGDQEVLMHPRGLLGFSLEASTKGSRRKIKLKIRWEESAEEREPDKAPLIIKAGGGDA